MKYILTTIILVLLLSSCRNTKNPETLKEDIINTEKAFEKMVADSGIAIAFYTFADENAIILRANDSIIKGKESIKKFYINKVNKNETLFWTPEFIEISDDGTLAYTYGNYTWKSVPDSGEIQIQNGKFHTVWKKQNDGSWKYVWD